MKRKQKRISEALIVMKESGQNLWKAIVKTSGNLEKNLKIE